MSMNGYDSGGNTIFVLYKIVNADSDKGDSSLYNAFPLPRGARGPSLADVKKQCAALHGLSHLGPEGYHWRVCVEDKPAPGESGGGKTFSWWDVQDENASLPVKTAASGTLYKFFSPQKSEPTVGDDVTKAAKGAFKSLGKAVTQAVVGQDGSSSDSGPMVSVIAFKLLDLVKMHDDFSHKNHGRGGHIPQPSNHRGAEPVRAQPKPRTPATPAPTPPQGSQYRPPSSQQAPAVRPAPARQPAPQRAPAPARSMGGVSEDSLMDFGPSAPTSTGSSAASSRVLHHAQSSPALFNNNRPNESRVERLKREYAEKKQTSNRVWDDVDQRWVEVDPAAVGGSMQATQSAPPGADAVNLSKKKELGISLDPANAVGKSKTVQAAVTQRVTEMKQSQAKAVNEVRQREAQKKSQEAEEDLVRRKLEPKLKAWSEEHGKKKQLRALLATLHTILWPGAEWKQVGIGDLLDDGKVKRCFHKASRVVHPDKTHHLGPEERFMAKRIFDALSQAKNDFDSGAK